MRICRFPSVLSLVTMAIIGLALQPAAAPGVEPLELQEATPNKPITLRDRLVVGLQARIPFELAFCDLVADKAEKGLLPQLLVDQTFFWARQRADSTRNMHNYRPITYFIPAMRARAEKLHISLDPPTGPTTERSRFFEALLDKTTFPFR